MISKTFIVTVYSDVIESDYTILITGEMELSSLCRGISFSDKHSIKKIDVVELTLLKELEEEISDETKPRDMEFGKK